jgi:N-terminal acetyltransferase B complex catalytic subunit
MPTIRRVHPSDLFHLNLCNLDSLTENYNLEFYLTYLMKWPSLFQCIEEHGKIVGYIMGKVESTPLSFQHSPHALPWHGHITVLTIAPQYRRLGYATLLTAALEKACNQQNTWFVDLFVRSSNTLAIEMYKKLGYSVFRRVVDYYSDDPTGRSGGKGEDAFDMRKPLDRDKERKYIREGGEEVRVGAEDVF